jgi:hypothetical protein
MSLFEMLSDEREKVRRLRDALSDLLAMCTPLPKPDTGTEHTWNQRVAAAEAIMKLTETKRNIVRAWETERIY